LLQWLEKEKGGEGESYLSDQLIREAQVRTAKFIGNTTGNKLQEKTPSKVQGKGVSLESVCSDRGIGGFPSEPPSAEKRIKEKGRRSILSKGERVEKNNLRTGL